METTKKTLKISFSTQKGGVGKSTMTTLLASVLHYRLGFNVLVMDCDFPQHSLTNMRERDKRTIMQNDYHKKAAMKQFQAINKKQLKKTGRRPKEDPATIRYTISFNEQEHARFLALFDKSGMQVKAHFITSCIFEKTIKTIQIDKGTVDFYMRLTSFHSQFRSIGVNYNQIVKLLYKNFSEKKAAAFLYKLEKQTAEMAMLCQKIIQITEKFEEEHLKK